MRKSQATRARQRLDALQVLAEGLSTSNPQVQPSGFVVVVEDDRPEFLGEALARLDGVAPVMAVGVRRLPPGPLPIHVCGRGTDASLMQYVISRIGEGRLGGGREVRLFTEPLRARWWSGVFREQAQCLRAPYAAQAVGMLGEHWSAEVLLNRSEEIVAEAHRLLSHPTHVADAQNRLRGMKRKQRRNTEEFVPGGKYHHALRHLLKNT